MIIKVHLLFLFSSLLLPVSRASYACTQTCGPRTVPFPFGFSPSCTIPLSCTSNTTIRIGEFTVQNFTSSNLLLSVPPSCTRPINSTASLFAPNYALTRNNGFLLRNCSSGSVAQCTISGQILSQRLSCASDKDSISFFTDANSTNTTSSGEFLTEADLTGTKCKFLLSSASIEAAPEGNQSVVLVFHELEVGWWVNGTCGRCDPNAECTRVIGKGGVRCRCKEGFEGDGFHVGGNGCRKVPHCGSTNLMSGKCEKSSRNIGLLVGAVVAGASLVALAGIMVVFCLVRRRSTPKHHKRTRRLLSEASFNVPVYPYKTIERATDNFSETLRLGTGAYGTVYVGQLSNGELIAVKKIKHPDPETIEQVINEVKMISSVNHPNLVRLLGCCIDRGQQILVYEFMSNGTLSQHLQHQRGPGLPWTIRLTIATATAKAIAYLHSAIDPPIFHRDIKSSNILLDHQFNAKIADFGLSRTVVMTEISHISTVPQGTPGYVDPQYHQNYHLSDKSDVYSFGVVLMEIISGLKVVDFNRVQSEVNLAAMAVDRIAKGRIDEIIDPYLKKQNDSWTLTSIHKVAELGFRCLAFHRDMRPSMIEVADELEQIMLSCWVPKDGEVVMPMPIELCTSPLIESEGKSRRLLDLVVSGRIDAEKVNSPVSVQDSWASERSNQSSSSFLGSSNRFGIQKE